MTDELPPGNQQSLAFMAEVRAATNDELEMLERWQACEPWRGEAIRREMWRRAAAKGKRESNDDV